MRPRCWPDRGVVGAGTTVDAAFGWPRHRHQPPSRRLLEIFEAAIVMAPYRSDAQRCAASAIASAFHFQSVDGARRAVAEPRLPDRARPRPDSGFWRYHPRKSSLTLLFVAARSPALAKLTRPKLYDALPRPRLFSLLDEAATRPIVWISAAPGSGKSTLVASYLEARNLRHVWYQADIGDADPATFIHYMRTAAAQIAGKTAAALPVFTPEPKQNLD